MLLQGFDSLYVQRLLNEKLHHKDIPALTIPDVLNLQAS
jgi:hypothetical protein